MRAGERSTLERNPGGHRLWERRGNSLPEPWEGTSPPTPRLQPSDTDTGLLTSGTVRGSLGDVLSHQVRGNSWQWR